MPNICARLLQLSNIKGYGLIGMELNRFTNSFTGLIIASIYSDEWLNSNEAFDTLLKDILIWESLADYLSQMTSVDQVPNYCHDCLTDVIII